MSLNSSGTLPWMGTLRGHRRLSPAFTACLLIVAIPAPSREYLYGYAGIHLKLLPTVTRKMITLYDFGPSFFDKAMGTSPFVRTIRFALNLKKIPYKVIELGLFDLTPTAKSIGAPPTGKKPDGTPKYTVPFIQDDSTGAVVSDSFLIAVYLDSTYPTPTLIPDGTHVLQSAFSRYIFNSLNPILPVVRAITERDFESEQVRAEVEKFRGAAAVEAMPTAEEQDKLWGQVVTELGAMVQGYYHGNRGSSVFVIGGENPTFADVFLTAFLWWIRTVFGEGGTEWRKITELGEGRVGKLYEETITLCGKKET